MSDRCWWERRWFALAAVLLGAVPLLWPALPPLLDLPGHMARYRVMLDGGTSPLAAWYAFHWRFIGYLGVDLLVAGLAPWFGLELTVKAIAIAIPMLTTTGMLWLSREAHGRVQPLALLALPLAYTLPFLYGFLNYTLAMALALNAFALWLRLTRQGRFRLRAGLFVVIAWLVWTAHLFGWLALGVMVFASEVARYRALGRGWGRAVLGAGVACLPLAPPALVLLHWHPGDGAGGSDYWARFPMKLGWFVALLRDRWQWIDLASLLLLVLLLYGSWRRRGQVRSASLAAAALAMTALFLLLPFGTAYIDARILPYAVILALLAEGTVPGRRLLAWVGLAFLLVRTLAVTADLAIEGRDWQRRLVALDHLPVGARVAAFIQNRCDAGWSIARLNHLPSMAVVRRSAFANDQFDLGSTGLMQVRRDGFGTFATDPSQIVVGDRCAAAMGIPTLRAALAGLPRGAFDHIWLIDPPADLQVANATRLWSDGRDALYRLEPQGGRAAR
nr:hypothetical protein [uncultured Sphingomonas sp.]